MKDSAIAIVGMAGRFPGARNLDEFWRNLRDGVESIRTLSDDELIAAGVSPQVFSQPEYVKAAAVLDDVDMFDASFFGFSPRDAAIMDPQHRHFLECAWEAFENSGHMPEFFDGSIGVFAGSGMNAYLIHNLIKNHRLMESAGLFLIRQTGNDKDVLATRVSYQLGLHGPSLAVQTACSTSLVAVHLACQSLLDFECDMALAGGVTIEIPHSQGYFYREGEILSRDGHCRSFDAASSGTVFSSGVGIVVLRRLADAIADHDTIHAVILGSAVNNDGRRKVGYLAPSVAGQAEAIAEALGVAGVDADTISYVETHGTGTTVGDPLEVEALTQAFRRDTGRNGFCKIGSLKTNVGHLDAAAGVAGLIKTVLALRHRQIPASLHFQKANPRVDFENSPFLVNHSLTPWHSDGVPRRAGVTSLGIGGTNVHVILEEAPEVVRSGTTFPHHLVVVSAQTEPALECATSRLAAHLRDNPSLRLADVALTSQIGRRAFRHRRFVVASTTAEAARLLTEKETPRGFQGTVEFPGSSSVVFLFSGQGSQYSSMGADLYANDPMFRTHLDRCADLLLPHLGLDLREILYPTSENAASAAIQLNRTSITQPALFALEYSLAQWWMASGVEPQAMLGHSVGEYVAACLADVLSLEDALAMIAARGRLMESCAAGGMLAVSIAREDLTLSANLWLAAVNAPEQCVVSGSLGAVAQMEQQLLAQGVLCRRLQSAHAFHSGMMDPILETFEARMRQVSLKPPRIPYLSNLTGTWITPHEATDPGYWAKHLRNTVRFSDCVTDLLRQSGRVMIEVGPGQSLAALVRQHIGKNSDGETAKVYSTLRPREQTIPDTAFLLETLGQLWVGGQPIHWPGFDRGDDVSRVPLPAYPFQRQRFWIDPDAAAEPPDPKPISQVSVSIDAAAEPAMSRTPGSCDECIDNWFYERVWRRTPQPEIASATSNCWVILLGRNEVGRQVTHQLRRNGDEVVEITPGKRFDRDRRGHYTIRPGVRDDYMALLADLSRRKISPRSIVHLWAIADGNAQLSLDQRLDRCFYSLLYLAQAVVEADIGGIDLAVISDRLHSLRSEPIVDPVCALLIGPTRVIPKEIREITCRSVDVDLTARPSEQAAGEIIAECRAESSDPIVALRHGERFVLSIERTELRADSGVSRFRERGVYVITGGLGDLGLVIARELARDFKARLVLLGRAALPPVDEWKTALVSDGTPEKVRRRIGELLEIESLGAEVLPLSCDICHPDQVKCSIETALLRFGAINGVIHAAGVIEDGPLLIKSQASVARVIDPKVRGTLVLFEVLDALAAGAKPRVSLDFAALFSSSSSLLAPAGQIDYAAANGFLDAFAASRRDARIVSINWGPWRDLGMAVRQSIAHPLLGQRLVDTGDEIIYSAPLSPERHWVLGEHRLKDGKAVFPGTGYLEMAAAALVRGSFDRGVEFEDVFFQAPLVGDPAVTSDVQVDLRRDGNYFLFSVHSSRAGWIEHASGRIGQQRRQPPPDRDLDHIRDRCQSRLITFDDTDRTRQERFFDFGPRWRCLKSIHFGESEALAELELAAAFVADASHYQLHPALLDLATGAALYLIDDYMASSALYVPIFYKRALIYHRLPSRFASHIRPGQRNEAGRDLATFDVSLLGEQGKVLAEIEGFSMRLMSDARDGLAMSRERLPVLTARPEPARARPRRGISPAAGAKAFTRIVSGDCPRGVLVLPDGHTDVTVARNTIVRSVTKKVVNAGDVETILTEWWREMLGVEDVGLDDDFFELGGQSLLVVRLFGKIKKTFSVTLGLSTFFEARTIRKLGRRIGEPKANDNSKSSRSRSIVAIQPEGTRPPLLVMSGLDGHVLAFHRLASHLGEDQPVYGLLPRGQDENEPYDERVEDIAAYYVDSIRELQPEGPYRLIGHSFGGIVAFEVAQQLLSRGADVGFLGLLDTSELGYRAQVAKTLGFRQKLVIYQSELKFARNEGDPFGPFRRLFERKTVKIASKFSNAIGRALPRSARTLKDVNLHALTRYRAQPYHAGMTLFRATSREPQDGTDELLGWGRLVAGGIEVHDVPSTHYNMLDEPAAKILASQLKRCLDLEKDHLVVSPIGLAAVGTPAR